MSAPDVASAHPGYDYQARPYVRHLRAPPLREITTLRTH
jgi:hypothetical protein